MLTSQKKSLIAITVIVVVVLAIVFVRERYQGQETSVQVIPEAEELLIKRGTQALSTGIELTVPKKSEETPTLASVNGEAITEEMLEEELSFLPEEYRQVFLEDKEALLKQLIVDELLVQEAIKLGLDQSSEVVRSLQQGLQRRKDILILALVQNISQDIQASNDELYSLYQDLTEQLQGKSFDDVKNTLRSYLLQEKQRQVLQQRILELQAAANVTYNTSWLETERQRLRQNPLDKVLGQGIPVVADFGQGTCIPCKQMQPILEELKTEYEGRSHVLIIETNRYPSLTRRHGVRLIPTQIFFNGTAKEVFRHEGFMSRKDIVQQLETMGVH